MAEASMERFGKTTKVWVAIITLVLAGLVFWGTQRESGRGGILAQVYFTTDDGATWFPDDIKKRPPFIQDGKEAVEAKIFQCKGGKPFVGYLRKMNARGAAESMKIPPPPAAGLPVQAVDEQINAADLLVKRPGDKNWVPIMSDEGTKIIAVRCPDANVPPDEVFP